MIQFFVKIGLAPMEIYNEIVNRLRDTVPPKTMVCKWTLRIKCDRTSINEDLYCGRPKRATKANATHFAKKNFSQISSVKV